MVPIDHKHEIARGIDHARYDSGIRFMETAATCAVGASIWPLRPEGGVSADGKLAVHAMSPAPYQGGDRRTPTFRRPGSFVARACCSP